MDNKKDNEEPIGLTGWLVLLREQCQEKFFWGKHHKYSWYPTLPSPPLPPLTYLPTYLLTYLPTYLPTYLLTYLPIY